MATPIFYGTTDDRGILIPDDPKRFTAYLLGLSGKALEFIVRKTRKARSLRQNAYYWGVVISTLSDHTGHDPEEIHEALKIKFLSHDDEKTGLLIVGSTAALSTIQFNEYCDRIQRWAAQFLGCYIPSPNECDYIQEDPRF